MDFRVTVRDNSTAGGSTAQDDMRVRVDDNSGPFRVLSPNTSVVWETGSYAVVAWDVAGSDQAPVSCSTVNIRLSNNGGQSFPILLAEGVPNTGKYCLEVPDIETGVARIMIEAADNIFFDISNANFKIETPSSPSFSLCVVSEEAQICLPQEATASISTSGLLGFDSLINLSVANLPAGASAVFSPNPVQAGETSQLSISFPADLDEGDIDLDIQGVSGTQTVLFQSTYTLVSNDFKNLSLLAPSNGATGLDQTPVLRWQTVADANSYDLEIASYPTFEMDSIAVTRSDLVTDSLKVPTLLEKGTVYYWRVRPVNECGPGPWVGPFAFSTLVNNCKTFESGDVPKSITGSLATTVESKVSVLSGGIISDVNLNGFQGFHEFFRDLEVHLVSPAGTDVLLFESKCGSFNGSFHLNFDDSAPGPLACPPSNGSLVYQPEEPLSAFNGEDAVGDWVLRVRDNVISSGGTINAYALEVCSNTTLNPPFIVKNNPLQLAPGTNKEIPVDLLEADDADNTDAELVYTLMTVPENGELQLFWSGTMEVGDQFTQADLNNNGLRYFDYGFNAGSDQFCFTVTDGTGGMAQDCFQVDPFAVSTSNPDRDLQFRIAPNPASDRVQIFFGEALQSGTLMQVFDTNGRMVHTSELAVGQQTAILSVANFPSGLYVVSLTNDMGRGVKKIMVR